MKKVFVVLAILAIASVAQAELLATWTFAGGNGTVTENATINADQVVFGDLVRTGLGTASTAAGQFSSNGWQDGGDISFSVTLSAGYFISGATMNIASIQGSNTGPGTTQWQLNGSDVAGASLTRTASTVTSWNATIGTIGTGANTLSIVAVGTANVTGGATASAGSLRINDLTMNGEVTSIPEPATMSLLGLGALAMALRRKIRK